MKKIKKSNYLLILYLIVLVFINLFVLNITFVFGNSMENILYAKDIVLVYKFNYSPKCNDIVVTNKDNTSKTNLIKRVVATEGQTVVIENNKVYVDNTELLYYSGLDTSDSEKINITVPNGKVFLLGDNYNYSKDSRHFDVIDKKDLLGKVVLRVFPFNKINLLE